MPDRYTPAQGCDESIVKLDESGLPSLDTAFGGLYGYKFRLTRYTFNCQDVSDHCLLYPLSLASSEGGEVAVATEDVSIERRDLLAALFETTKQTNEEVEKSIKHFLCCICGMKSDCEAQTLFGHAGDTTVTHSFAFFYYQCGRSECWVAIKSMMKDYVNSHKPPRFPHSHACVRYKCKVIGDSSKPLKTCSRCHTVRYCSVACQTAAWPEHKTSCRSMGEARKAAKAAKLEQQQ